MYLMLRKTQNVNTVNVLSQTKNPGSKNDYPIEAEKQHILKLKQGHKRRSDEDDAWMTGLKICKQATLDGQASQNSRLQR